jgi:hypothetical protein
VLKGGSNVLEHHRPVILCEALMGYQETEQGLNEARQEKRYRAFLLTGGGPRPKERVEGVPRVPNYLFAAEEWVDERGAEYGLG